MICNFVYLSFSMPVFGLREFRAVARFLRFSELPSLLSTRRQLCPLYVHWWPWGDRRGRICRVWPSAAFKDTQVCNCCWIYKI